MKLVCNVILTIRNVERIKGNRLKIESRYSPIIRSALPPEAAPPEGPPDETPQDKEADERAASPGNIGQLYQKLRREIDRVDTWVNVAADNGLFNEQTAIPYNQVQEPLHQARLNLDGNLLSCCETNISNAIDAYSKALYATRKRWRFFNIYAGHIWIYLVAFLCIVLVFYLYKGVYLENSAHIAQAAIHATTWGVIGSILRGMWFLKERVGDRQYRNSWTIYFLSVPFLGGIFGAIIYLVIIAGLLSFNGTTNNSSTPSNPLVIIPIAVFAGFNWEWAVAIFKRIGDLLLPTAPTQEHKVP